MRTPTHLHFLLAAAATLSCAGPAMPTPQPQEEPPVATARDAAQDVLAEARTLREGGRAQEAADLLRKAEQEHGEDARLRLLRGWTHMDMAAAAMAGGQDKFMVKGHVADAHLCLDQAVALDATVEGAAVLLARILRWEENPDAARETLSAHLAVHPGDVDARLERGDMEFLARNWAEVEAQYEPVVRARPDDGIARYRLTYARHWLGFPMADIETGYLLAARLLPENEEPLRLLSRLHPGDREPTEALFRKVVEETPGAVLARVYLAWVLREVGTPDLAAAQKVLEEALVLAPGNAVVHHNMAELHLKAGRCPEAVASGTRAVELGLPAASPFVDRILFTREALVVPLPLREKAYDALIAANPGVGAYGNNAGLWFRDLGKDYEKSLHYYLRSLDARPDDQDYLNDTALIYLFHLTDRRHECLPLFEKVLRLVDEEGEEPVRGYWDTLENLCKYWFEEGDYAKVIEYADRRADPAASFPGQPSYPSMKAAAWKAAARKALGE